MSTYFTLLPWNKIQIVKEVDVDNNWFTLLPFDKIEIVQPLKEGNQS
jgi:hypothetical protein